MQLPRPLAILPLVLASCVSWPAFHAESYEERDPSPFPHPERTSLDIAANGSAGDLLCARRYRRLWIEVDWYEGCRPSDWALRNLEWTAIAWCDKPDGIEVVRGEEIRAADEPWDGTEEGIAAIGARHFDALGEDGTLEVYVLCMPGIPGTATLGTAGAALPRQDERPNLALYRRAIEANARYHFSANEVEASTLVHEFGHLLGLTTNPVHHVADDWPHCTRPECAMTGVPLGKAVLGNLFHSPWRLVFGLLPKTFCTLCRSDLRAIRETALRTHPLDGDASAAPGSSSDG